MAVLKNFYLFAQCPPKIWTEMFRANFLKVFSMLGFQNWNANHNVCAYACTTCPSIVINDPIRAIFETETDITDKNNGSEPTVRRGYFGGLFVARYTHVVFASFALFLKGGLLLSNWKGCFRGHCCFARGIKLASMRMTISTILKSRDSLFSSRLGSSLVSSSSLVPYSSTLSFCWGWSSTPCRGQPPRPSWTCPVTWLRCQIARTVCPCLCTTTRASWERTRTLPDLTSSAWFSFQCSSSCLCSSTS